MSNNKTSEFIIKAKEINGDKFDYSLVDYKNCDTKVKIKCITCNKIFEQIPYNHINKKAGCVNCYTINKYKITLNQRLNEFIKKAKEIHNNNYDYTKVNFVNSKTPIIIICNKCNNEFKNTTNAHLKGDGGCKICAINKFKKERTFTNEQFIEKANKVHNNNYNYSQVNYINSQTYINILCNKCNHSFQILPNNHLRGKGCKKCANKLNAIKRMKSLEQFIMESKEVHKDENDLPIYDYSLVDYKSTHEKVIIICKSHGNFLQTPSYHLQGSGCNKCGIIDRAKKQTFTKEEFIERAIKIHNNKYNYSQVNYINSQTPIIIICNICDYIFNQLPNSHLRGSGCDKCAHKINHENQKLTEVEIIQRAIKVHGNNFDYSNINYQNSQTPINIKCNTCKNNFSQLYTNHITHKQGCPFCSFRKTEKKLFEKLIVLFPKENDIIKEFKQKWCKDKKYLPFDFVISKYNIIIELDGEQHFIQIMNWKSPKDTQKIDKYKMECANKNNYSVIRILQKDVYYDRYDWYNELNQNIQKIINEKTIQNIYMCKNNEYDVFNNK
jgi:very-short-patch-repair endonuclease